MEIEMFAIYKKEMRSYFTNPIGYIFVGIFLVFAALLCCITIVGIPVGVQAFKFSKLSLAPFGTKVKK